MSESTLGAIDKQIVSWIEQLDGLYAERMKITRRISDIEERLSAMKKARRALALEWGDTSEEIPIPRQYTSEGVRRVVNMALVNDSDVESDGKGKYWLEVPF